MEQEKYEFDITKGVIDEYRPSDYIAGVASNIPFEDRMPSSNWDKWLPEDNSQWMSIKKDARGNTILYVDYFACVTYSALSDVETQLNWLYHNGMKEEAKNFFMSKGFIVNGKFKLSNRFTAIMSGTTIQGNSLQKVIDSIRKDGILPEAMFPDPTKDYFDDIVATTPNTNQGQVDFTINCRKKYLDRKYITDAMVAMAKESSKYFSAQYEWIVLPNVTDELTLEEKREAVLKHLRQAPLQLAKKGHAQDYYMAVHKQKMGIYDSYPPYKKDEAWTYDAPWVMKIVVGNQTNYSIGEIMDAQKQVLSIMKGRPTLYFFRPEANGEGYKSYLDGSFKYLHQLPGAMFNEMCADKTITPISEDLWNKIKAAEIK